MARFELGDTPAAVEVNLGDGHEFVVREITKHVGEKSRPLAREISTKLDADLETADEVVALIGDYLDVMLKRVGNADGPASKPSTLIRKAWEGNSLSESQVAELWAFVVTRGGEDSEGDGAPPT